ncbi:ChaN family lipoprotein [Iodobacter sp. CM08]|uniref:ChaN family lipoprotein n=1 Tax=Iodobacter sp. CM08 TaxID=3085902 RepID=UPI0029825848|nr:ChaN family lipoprotein [Iodobacter sp. CM08]MDW5418552.1 ChaN family lipoprotein [Iodobacter sp. CM08]
MYKKFLLCSVLVLAGCATSNVPFAGKSYVLMGEVHDNALGHQARFKALEQAVQQGWRPAIAMEQFDRERQAELDQARSEQPNNPDYLIQKVGGSRWDWSLYRPVIELALRYDLPIVAANLSRKDASVVVKQGVSALADAQELGLMQPLPAGLLAAQREEVRVGHCGKLPENLLDGMALAQIARDTAMAKVMKPYQTRGVVLLAGNGHVRRDVGVPLWLPNTLSLGFVEASHKDIFDQENLIAPAQRADPCAGL